MAPKKAASTPTSTPALKKSSSSGGQRTLFGFFQKTPSTGSPAALPAPTVATTPIASKPRPKTAGTTSGSSLTPAPSSDGPEPEIEDERTKASSPPPKGLPSPVSTDERQTDGLDELNARGTPSRKACFSQFSTQSTINMEQAKKKTISYMESDSEGTDDDDVFKPQRAVRSRPTKRRRLSDSAEEDVYEQENEEEPDDGEILRPSCKKPYS